MQNQRAANEALASLGLTLVQWDALRHLAANPDASLHDLARLTFQTDQSMGALARRLIAGGLVQRAYGPGRAVHHELTEKGRRLHEAGGEVVDAVLATTFARLTAAQLTDLDDLLQLLVRPPAAGGGQPQT